MKKKIYIIGHIPNVIDVSCEAKFYRAQMKLIEMGFEVINPIARLKNNFILPETAKRRNLQDLMLANAVYIMPCVPMGPGIKNVEIKLALDFNLTIIIASLDLSETDQITKIDFNNSKVVAY